LSLSTWEGFELSFTFAAFGYQTPMSVYGIDNIPLMVFLDGCLTSGAVWIIHNFEEMMERVNNDY
jgi:hypothetical protein